MISSTYVCNAGALIAVFVLAVSPAAAQSPADHGADHHPQADPPVIAFHELMEPLWRAPPGPETNARTCNLAGDIVSHAAATTAAAQPNPDRAALVASARTLQQACGERDAAAVTAELIRLHALFHRIAGGGRS